MNYIMARLGEHSTQVAIGGAVATLSAAFQGQLSWGTAASLLLGTLVTAVMPTTTDQPAQTPTVVVPPSMSMPPATPPKS